MSIRDSHSIGDLRALAKNVRADVLRLCADGKTSHVASALSCVDLLVGAYFSALRIDPAHPDDENRDRFILSKGHASVAHYVTLAKRGYFPEILLDEFAKDGGMLAEQPGPRCVPGIELATGSLGHGLGVGLGMAYAAKLKHEEYRVFVLLSDGECGEGSVWEAALLAPILRLDNLVAVVDYNKFQATGRSNEILALDPLADKWETFGWSAAEIQDGNDVAQVVAALNSVPVRPGKPTAFIAHTTKGKGVSFMENDLVWHYRWPRPDELARALAEIKAQ